MKYKKTADTLITNSHTLHRKYYVDNDILDEEYNKIFLQNWICVGREDELINTGDFKTIKIGYESIIIIKNEANMLSAYFNVCRHRGTRICNEENGHYSKTIQCGYHGWTYNLDGHLIGAPHMENVSGFDKKDYPLSLIHI